MLAAALVMAVACASDPGAPIMPPTLAQPTLAPTATVSQPSPTTIMTQPSLTPVREPTAIATVVPEVTATEPLPSPSATPSPTPCPQPGQIEHGQVDTAVAGPFAYRIYLPPCYGADDHLYPTLYLLPGNIHDDSIWDVLGIDEAADEAILAGLLQPLLIVMPDGGWVANQTSGGPGSYEEVIVNELIPHIEQTYCAWPDRAGRAIGGLSRGGYWSLEITFRHPELFRSVGGHSLALIDSHAGEGVDPVQTGVTNDLGDLRIYLDLGNRDPYLVEARPLHEALLAAGVDHVWLVNEGQHENAYWEAHLPEYLTWYNEGWLMDRTELPECKARLN